MGKIALLYAPAKGSTEKVAKLVASKIGEGKVDLVLVEDDLQPSELLIYDEIIFGISTVGRDSWDANYSKTGWDFFLPRLEDFDFSNKTVAIFGLGDHILYANNFVDAMGTLGKIVIKKGGNLVGQTTTYGYTFDESDALVGDAFLGLPIDEDNESELTEERVNKWLTQIANDFNF